MSVTLRGEASFEHEGSELKLVMDVAALLEVEDATGLGLFDLTGTGLAKLTVLAAMLAASAARGSGQQFSRVEAAEILMVNPKARDAVVKALHAALPVPGKAKAGNVQAARKRGTGKNS